MPSVFIFVILGFVLLIGLNILTVRSTIRRALRKTIVPELKEKGFEYLDYRWCGVFSTGDFNEKITIGPGSPNGSASQSIYIDVFYNADKQPRKITVRIDTIFFFIKRVKYSSDF